MPKAAKTIPCCHHNQIDQQVGVTTTPTSAIAEIETRRKAFTDGRTTVSELALGHVASELVSDRRTGQKHSEQ
jgi:hypothetical protein